MQNLKEVIENLKAEQKKQGIAPAGFSIRERVEGRLEELENEVEQLRYESACFTIRSKENESSACQMLSWEEKKNLLLLYFDDILVTVQWLVTYLCDAERDRHRRGKVFPDAYGGRRRGNCHHKL